MALPEGFHWTPASQHERGLPSALTLDGEEVARMMERLDGTWFVLLDRQAPAPPGERFAPLVTRDCSSFDQGRLGTEIWAERHEARIRKEVAVKIAARPQHMAIRR